MSDLIGSMPAGQQFANQHQFAPGATVADFLARAFKSPVAEREWKQFLASQPWFEGHYLGEVTRVMQANGVKIATYALTWNPVPAEARPESVSSSTTPWFLNQLLVPGLAYVPGSSRYPENYEFLDDYRNYQRAGCQ